MKSGRLIPAGLRDRLHKATAPVEHKTSHLGVPATFKLDLAAMHLYQAFCVGCEFGGIYHVGSSLHRANFRDVDVVCILDDEEFGRLFPDVVHPEHGYFEHDPRWLLMSVWISDWLTAQVGLPVDFKFQPMTFANAKHGRKQGKVRSALGHRTQAKRLSKEDDNGQA